MKNVVSYICVYNDKEQLKNMLQESLYKVFPDNNMGGGNAILIDNTPNQYHSCAEAYNKEIIANESKLNDILIFVHQDIAFDDDRLQERIIIELMDNPNQILGVAGMPKGGRTISNLKYLKTGKYITTTQVAEKTEVHSLDECYFAMTKELYFKMKFDEQTCSHWHLYAVDFCYEARRKYGIKSYVLPESIYHKMDGASGLSTDIHFLWTMFKMTRKYQKEFNIIYTPCYIVSTYYPKTIFKLCRSILKNLFSKTIEVINMVCRRFLS